MKNKSNNRRIFYFIVLLLFILFILLLSVNFNHQISRIGYHVDTKSSLYVDCKIPVKKFEVIPDTIARIIGTLKLSDAGFSRHCSEEDAMAIIRQEGCALGADFANISKEKLPDNESNCYRCKAEFYKYSK